MTVVAMRRKLFKCPQNKFQSFAFPAGAGEQQKKFVVLHAETRAGFGAFAFLKARDFHAIADQMNSFRRKFKMFKDFVFDHFGIDDDAARVFAD